MADRASPIQKNYPLPGDFVPLARRLKPNAIHVMLKYVWQGYDCLREDDCFMVTKGDAHIEDEITVALHARIQDIMQQSDPFSPFAVVHQPIEGEHQKHAGRSPQCDLGFRMLGGNVRSHFSIEAKVIYTDGAVSEYVNEIHSNFLPGRYSTFTSEAAMLGYLLSGKPTVAFSSIATLLNCSLHQCAAFSKREHRCSHHQRSLKKGRKVTSEFCCHHLMMSFV